MKTQAQNTAYVNLGLTTDVLQDLITEDAAAQAALGPAQQRATEARAALIAGVNNAAAKDAVFRETFVLPAGVTWTAP